MNNPPTLVVLIPVLRRPWRVVHVWGSIRATTPDTTRIVFIPDPDDVEENLAIAEIGAERLLVSGNYARKINAGVAATKEDLIFLGADDLHFHRGWFETAVKALESNPAAGVIGTNDVCNPRTAQGHSTHSLVTRSYTRLGSIDDPNQFLHESYLHERCDDEMVGTAKYRNAYVHVPDCIVEHLHPMVGKAPMDDLYAAQEERMRKSWPIYEQRRHLWGE